MDRHDAYTAMLSRHRHVIWAMCRDHAHGQWDDCCDLVQEVSLRLWIEFDKLRPDASPKEEREWVRWVTRKVFFLENRKRRLSTVTLTREAVAVPASDEEMRYREYVEEMMAALSPEEQRLLSLKMEGYNADEIASIMGLKRNAVYQRMHRIALKARKVLVVVLLLIGTSMVAVAVVPQWRKTVFGIEKEKTVPQEESQPSTPPKQPSSSLPQEETDSIVSVKPWAPPEPVPYLEAVPLEADTGHPPLPQVHRIQPVIIMSAHRLIVSGAEGEMVRIYNDDGKLVAAQRCNGLCYFNLAPRRDGYIIQVGDDPANRYRLQF